MTSPTRTTSQGVPLTNLALKYIHPIGQAHKALAGTGKSGLTPLPSPTATSTPAQLAKNDDYEDYQRHNFYSFSTKELAEATAFAPSYLYFGTPTNNPINPLFQRDKWLSEVKNSVPFLVFPGFGNGHWCAGNDRVWSILQPSLRLASQLVEQHDLINVWSTLLDGQYSSIEKGIPDIWKGDQLLRVRAPARGGNPGGRSGFIKNLQDIFEDIDFTITGGSTLLLSGLPVPGNFAFGRTRHDSDNDICIIEIAVEILEPLLRDDLLPSERMVDEFRVAVTLVHETCHAVWMRICKYQGKTIRDVEPYFEDQCLSELGFAMEEEVFGGKTDYLTSVSNYPWQDGNCLSSAGTFRYSWNSAYSLNLGIPAPEVSPFPRSWNYIDVFPTPIGFYESLNHADFWTIHARAFSDTLKIGPKYLGSRYNISTLDLSIHGFPFQAHDSSLIPIDTSMTPAAVSAATFENNRRTIASKIQQVASKAKIDANRRNVLAQTSNPNTRQASTTGARTESDLPVSCPRYEEIRSYLLRNRGQGRLCLDTMDFEMPENTLLNHILLLGGLQLTTAEWRDFLRVADDRNELFRWRADGRGMVTWTIRSPPAGLIMATGLHASFLSETYNSPKFATEFADFEFNYVLQTYNSIYDQYNVRITASVLRDTIDACSAKMDLWCWGPNGVVRRLDSTWPPRRLP